MKSEPYTGFKTVIRQFSEQDGQEVEYSAARLSLGASHIFCVDLCLCSLPRKESWDLGLYGYTKSTKYSYTTCCSDNVALV